MELGDSSMLQKRGALQVESGGELVMTNREVRRSAVDGGIGKGTNGRMRKEGKLAGKGP